MQSLLLDCVLCGLVVGFLSSPVTAETLLEDFESEAAQSRWQFSNGAEFAGARGAFSRTGDSARSGKCGGKLSFDFSNGGRYVSAILSVPPQSARNLAGVSVWLKVPQGHGVQLRYTDQQGQTFQKPVEFAPDNWDQAVVYFSDWTSHWGGPNDGKVSGPPKTLALLVDQGEHTTGAMLLDDIAGLSAAPAPARVSYPAYVFDQGEGWSMRADGDPGVSRLDGKRWKLDFTKGAKSISLTLPDRVLLGNVEKIRLRFSGSLKSRSARVSLRTHFMTFHKTYSDWAEERELMIDAPPGPGWTWSGGENDGKIHGPLRLGEIQVQAGTAGGVSDIQLEEVLVESSCPESKRCVLLAETSDDSSNFSATVRALSETPLEGELAWVLRDWEGNKMGSGSSKITIPARAQPARLEVAIRPEQVARKRFLEAEFTLNVPGQKVPSVAAVWLDTASRKPRDAALEPSSPFGMGLYLNRYRGDAPGLALMERAAQMARDAGVKWSREDFSWSRIEPRRGAYDWAYYDKLLECARSNGITVYAIVGYWTSWTQPYTEQGINDYVAFVRRLVERYKGQIKQWEIWNEPNIFFWQGPRDMYADLLRRSYAAIKELDPAAEVLGLSTAGIDRAYIGRMLELKAPFDILTIHPYRKQLNDLAFINDLKAVSDQVRLPDGTRRPVWLTEMGWATHTPHNTVAQDFAPNPQRTQAELIVRSYLCAIVSGVDPRTFWYNFRNDGEDPIYFEHQMGIVFNDFRPKAAYATYSELTRVLKGMRLQGPIDSPEGVLAYRFKAISGHREVLVAWSPAADTIFRLESSGAVKRVNAVGEESELVPAQGFVSVHLRKGAAVYVVR